MLSGAYAGGPGTTIEAVPAPNHNPDNIRIQGLTLTVTPPPRMPQAYRTLGAKRSLLVTQGLEGSATSFTERTTSLPLPPAQAGLDRDTKSYLKSHLWPEH